MSRLPALNNFEKSELADFEEYVAKSLQRGRDVLAQYPVCLLTPRKTALLTRLEEAFRKRICPPHINLLLGGLAEDDYMPPKPLQHINTKDSTPRNYWPTIRPELLRTCEDCLSYIEPEAFCYLLPAYLRLTIERPGYLCYDSVFFHLCYEPCDRSCRLLAPLSSSEKEIVTDILNERRCEQLFNDDFFEDKNLLPWEYERFVAEGQALSPRDFAENLALEYAERTGFLENNY